MAKGILFPTNLNHHIARFQRQPEPLLLLHLVLAAGPRFHSQSNVLFFWRLTTQYLPTVYMSIRSIDTFRCFFFDVFDPHTHILGHQYVGATLTDISQTPPESFEPGYVTEYQQNE